MEHINDLLLSPAGRFQKSITWPDLRGPRSFIYGNQNSCSLLLFFWTRLLCSLALAVPFNYSLNFGLALCPVILVLCNLRRITSLFDVEGSGLGVY